MPIKNVKMGKNVRIPYKELVNLYECELGDNVFIGPFAELGKGVKIGDRSRISSHTYVCDGVFIGKDCFIGHGVMFINDKFTEKRDKWIFRKTFIGNNVRIGSNTTILPIKIGNGSIIGAGSVVTGNVPDNQIVMGNPARIMI